LRPGDIGDAGRDPDLRRLVQTMGENSYDASVVTNGRDPVGWHDGFDGRGDLPMTVIAREDSLSGQLVMSGDGRLLGRFQGRVECAGELLIGTDAVVEADITAGDVTIAGHVRGNLTASGRLRIVATGRVEGDAVVGSLIVQEGGVHHGQLRVHPEGVPVQPMPAPASTTAEPRPTATRPAPAPRPRQATGRGPVARARKLYQDLF
jgi:cytoskeletal protein CcmA (bactofilin family)